MWDMGSCQYTVAHRLSTYKVIIASLLRNLGDKIDWNELHPTLAYYFWGFFIPVRSSGGNGSWLVLKNNA